MFRRDFIIEIAEPFQLTCIDHRSAVLRRRLTLFHFMFEQFDPVIVTEVYTREWERRLIAALFEQACVVVQRDERQKTSGEQGHSVFIIKMAVQLKKSAF